jgi:pSer/pThr/pTyr-binding forkhead associated (FHA) protein
MSNTKMCPNGHIMEVSWDRCPYCPQGAPAPGGAAPAGRPAVPPTRMATPAAVEPAPAPAPPPMPVPVAAPRAQQDAKKTRMFLEDAAPPVVGWLVAITGNHKGEDFRVRSGRTSVGSEGDCDICLSDDYISTRHANIKFVEKDGERIFILTDLDSSNGTFLNDSEEPIAREELVDNDTVTFGKTQMKFKCL